MVARAALIELVEVADTVTEIHEVKHAYTQGTERRAAPTTDPTTDPTTHPARSARRSAIGKTRDMTLLHDRLAGLPRADDEVFSAVEQRASEIFRPSGALSWLDETAALIASWQRNVRPVIARPAGVIFAADHGVAAANVSAHSPGITASMLTAYRAGQATINAFARAAGAELVAVDVGVGDPTGDIRTESAMSPERFDAVVQTAFDTIDGLDCDLLVLGEMGVGNTTASAAIAASLAGGEAASWIGRGTGVDDDGLARKREAVQQAQRRIAGITDPIEILREVGGAELAAIAAATIAARHRSIPVVLDGYITAASVLPLAMVDPSTLDHCIVGHCSAEPGHRKLLERLDKHPLLDLDMRLGEGSGAMAAVPLIRMACAGITEVPTFDEFFA